MLMMRRKRGETILIGDRIQVRILRIGRARVQIGIEAPRELRVIAQEVAQVSEQNRAAADSRLDPAVAARIARAFRQASSENVEPPAGPRNR